MRFANNNQCTVILEILVPSNYIQRQRFPSIIFINGRYLTTKRTRLMTYGDRPFHVAAVQNFGNHRFIFNFSNDFAVVVLTLYH